MRSHKRTKARQARRRYTRAPSPVVGMYTDSGDRVRYRDNNCRSPRPTHPINTTHSEEHNPNAHHEQHPRQDRHPRAHTHANAAHTHPPLHVPTTNWTINRRRKRVSRRVRATNKERHISRIIGGRPNVSASHTHIRTGATSIPPTPQAPKTNGGPRIRHTEAPESAGTHNAEHQDEYREDQRR